MKSILIVNHYATPPMYGGLTRHHYFAKYLKEKGYNVKILASSAIHNSDVNMINKKEKKLYKEITIDKVDYIYVKTCSYKNKLKRIINMLQYYFRAKKVAKNLDNYDVIYASTPQPLSALLGIKIAKKQKATSIVEVRDLWPESIVSFGLLSRKNIIIKVLYSLEKYIYTHSDKLVFTMEGAKEYLKEHHIKYNKYYHLNNGIDLKKYNLEIKENKINDKDLNNKKFKVVYAGSLRFIYDIKKIADVAKSFLNIKDIEFLIYGAGPYKDEIENYCKENNINNIKFKGFVDVKYLPYILSKCNLNLLHGLNSDVFKYGTSTNKSFMYLASGKPIISIYNNKYDLIKKHKCGITLKNTEVNDYHKAILKFYNMDKKEYLEYCNNCKKLSLEYDYERLTDKLIKIIEE